jgi:hypothetical protein
VDWDLLDVEDLLTVTATSANPFTIRVVALNASGSAGSLAGFDNQQSYAWSIAQAAALEGFSASAFAIDASAFADHLGGGALAVASSGGQLMLTFTPVPEPAAAAVCMMAALSLLLRRRGRRCPGR